MKFHLPVSDITLHRHHKRVSPTVTCTEEIREQFCADLSTELGDTPATDKHVIQGDFNARVGKDDEQWRGVIGKRGVEQINSKGLLLLSKCAEYNVLITNTIFRLADKYKTLWMHLRSRDWHLIDYITTRQRDSSDVITRAMRGAKCWTDNRLIRAKPNIRIVPQHHKPPKLIRQASNTARLLSAKYRQEFQSTLDDKSEAIGPLIGRPEEKWTHDRWWEQKAEEVQLYADTNIPAELYKAVGTTASKAFHDILVSI